MTIREALRRPEPVPIRVSSRANREQFAAALARALSDRRYSNPRGDDVFMRLRGGSVTASDATFTVKTYVMPGVRSRGNVDKLVVGSFSDTPTGSEFAGLVSAPISRRSIWPLAVWAVFMALVLAAFVRSVAFTGASPTDGPAPLLRDIAAGILALAAALLILAPVAFLWALMFRYKQRANLREVGSLSHFLEAIATEAESNARGSARPDQASARPFSTATA